jgi:hypothetical protein
VGRHHHGRAALTVQCHQEIERPALALDVEADRRLVEEDHLRVVQERGRQLAAHDLPQRELADRGLQERPQVEQLDEHGEVAPVPVRGDAVHVAEDVERVAQRQVPPELAPLAEDHTDPASQGHPLACRVEARDANGAGGGEEDAGQHLHRGRLARAVRADVADHLARPDLERDAVHGPDDGSAPAHQAGPAQDRELLREAGGGDGGSQLPVPR